MDIIEAATREVIRSNLDPDATVEYCVVEGCETDFVALTAEDYAVHLVDEHPYYQSQHAVKAILRATWKAVRNSGGSGFGEDRETTVEVSSDDGQY